MQEYYANTGALKQAAESARGGRKVGCSIVETFSKSTKPRELEEVLRLEYRSKLLNPKWAEVCALVILESGAQDCWQTVMQEAQPSLMAILARQTLLEGWSRKILPGQGWTKTLLLSLNLPDLATSIAQTS